MHIRSDKQTASTAFPQLPTGLREGGEGSKIGQQISSCLAQQKIWVFWRNFPREDYEKDIFSMVSATDQAENSWCGEIKCVLSKQNFLNLFKGLSPEIATSELQKFPIFGGYFSCSACQQIKLLTIPSVEENLHLSQWIPLSVNGRLPHYSLLLLVMLHTALNQTLSVNKHCRIAFWIKPLEYAIPLADLKPWPPETSSIWDIAHSWLLPCTLLSCIMLFNIQYMNCILATANQYC